MHVLFLYAAENCFPDGVFDLYFGPAESSTIDSYRKQIANNQQLLLKCLRGDGDAATVSELSNSTQFELVSRQLAECLRGRKCLLLLDDVRSNLITTSFTNFRGFRGKLLVTGLDARTAWQDVDMATNERCQRIKPVHISPGGKYETDLEWESRHAFEHQLLAVRSSGNPNAKEVEPDFKVGRFKTA